MKTIGPETKYAGTLYPREIHNIWTFVLNRGPLKYPFRYSGDPEVEIDSRIRDWTTRNVLDRRRYVGDIGLAAKDLDCGELVFRRINLETVLKKDTGDSITIYSNPVRNLLAVADGRIRIHTIEATVNGQTTKDTFEIYWQDLEESKKDAIKQFKKKYPELWLDGTPTIKITTLNNASDLYQSKKTIITRPPRETWQDQTKADIRAHLESLNFPFIAYPDTAAIALEKAVKRHTVEQNIIGRLAYLVIFKAFLDMPTMSKIGLLALAKPMIEGPDTKPK